MVSLSTGAYAQGQALSGQDYCHELSKLYRAYARFNTISAAAADAKISLPKQKP